MQKRQICSPSLHPLIKWVGGKAQLLVKLRSMMPKEYHTYFEPFIGGAALYCNICPNSAVINDINPKLINLYSAVKSDTDNLISLLDSLQAQFNGYLTQREREDFYYQIRTQFNIEPLGTEQAAHFVFLNKLCFNGLYRENTKGEFNASFNGSTSINLYERSNLLNFAKQLQNTTILNVDFEEACESASAGDFVFFDSPYYDTFDKYTSMMFLEADHIRLYNLAKHLTDIGCHVMLTNNDCAYIRELYADFNITQVAVKRKVNCDAANRVGSEIIITNY